MKLTFNKLKDKRYENLEYDWMMKIETLDQLLFFHESWMKAQIPLAWDNLKKVAQGRAHINSGLAHMIAWGTDGKRGLIEITAELSERFLKEKYDYISKGIVLYINKMGGYMPEHSDIEVIDTMERDIDNDLIFPNYTEKDIRIKKWEGGKHFYAYVGMFSVIDWKGDMKWNTEKEAMEKAEGFLYRINKRAFAFKGEKIERN